MTTADVLRARFRKAHRLLAIRRFQSTLVLVACVALVVYIDPFGAARGGADKIRIAFVGDSTADGLWGGVSSLAPREPCLKEFELGRFGKNSTGLTRPDRFNWADGVQRIGENFKSQLYLMSLGINDQQSIVEGGTVILENSPDYRAKYKARVTAVLNSAIRNSTTSLLWVGLPTMRDAAADRNAREKNSLFAEAIVDFASPKVEFVEPWKANQAGEDKFASFAPDQSGRIVQIRSSDGLHFTPAGELLVAIYLWPKIVANLGKNGLRLPAACTS
jgi:hypothetical protein